MLETHHTAPGGNFYINSVYALEFYNYKTGLPPQITCFLSSFFYKTTSTILTTALQLTQANCVIPALSTTCYKARPSRCDWHRIDASSCGTPAAQGWIQVSRRWRNRAGRGCPHGRGSLWMGEEPGSSSDVGSKLPLAGTALRRPISPAGSCTVERQWPPNLCWIQYRPADRPVLVQDRPVLQSTLSDGLKDYLW